MLHLSKNRVINGAYCTTGAQFANHSTSNPNATMRCTSTSPGLRGYNTLTSTKSIPPPTEITWNYGRDYWKATFSTTTQELPPGVIFDNLDSPQNPPLQNPYPTPDLSVSAILAFTPQDDRTFIDELYVAANVRGGRAGIVRSLFNSMLNP